MALMRIYSSRVYTSEGCKSAAVEMDGGKIVAIDETERCPDGAIDYGSRRVIPGIFDTHNHGTQGYDLMFGDDFDDRCENVRGYLKGLASQGTVCVFPTVADPEGIAAVAAVASEGLSEGSQILGIHAEGPWLSRVGEKGVRTGWPEVSLQTAKQMFEASCGLLRLVALAPEIPGIEEIESYFLGHGVMLAAAHSDNGYQTAAKAYRSGISVATHTGNVMTDMHHRDVGGLGAALLDDGVTCEVICDGLHICNEMLRIYFRIKDPKHFVMISDCTAFSGAPVGSYSSPMASSLTVTPDGFVLSDTGRLMGSSQPVLFGIGNLVDHVGVPLETCLKMASLNPAIVYGFSDRKGSIEVGKDADLVVISDDWHAIDTYSLGKKVYDREVDGSVYNGSFVQRHAM